MKLVPFPVASVPGAGAGGRGSLADGSTSKTDPCAGVTAGYLFSTAVSAGRP
jgi:hypothetical protein